MEGRDDADVAGNVCAPRRKRCDRRRLLERVVARAARVRAPGRGRSPSWRPPGSTDPCCRSWRPARSRSARSRRRSPRRRGSHRPPRSRWDAAMRWRPRSARASSRRARSAMWSAPPSRCAPRRPSRGRTRRCSWSATRTRTPTRGCWRTPVSSPAATSGGGATSSRPSSAPPRRKGWATRMTSSPRKRRRCPPARKASCSFRACRARWRPSGTARRVACSTGSRSPTRAPI